jgi:hypothetical protein
MHCPGAPKPSVSRSAIGTSRAQPLALQPSGAPRHVASGTYPSREARSPAAAGGLAGPHGALQLRAGCVAPAAGLLALGMLLGEMRGPLERLGDPQEQLCQLQASIRAAHRPGAGEHVPLRSAYADGHHDTTNLPTDQPPNSGRSDQHAASSRSITL